MSRAFYSDPKFSGTFRPPLRKIPAKVPGYRVPATRSSVNPATLAAVPCHLHRKRNALRARCSDTGSPPAHRTARRRHSRHSRLAGRPINTCFSCFFFASSPPDATVFCSANLRRQDVTVSLLSSSYATFANSARENRTERDPPPADDAARGRRLQQLSFADGRHAEGAEAAEE